jgi:hypothetical protein
MYSPPEIGAGRVQNASGLEIDRYLYDHKSVMILPFTNSRG